jgi:hypothetical protein
MPYDQAGYDNIMPGEEPDFNETQVLHQHDVILETKLKLEKQKLELGKLRIALGLFARGRALTDDNIYRLSVLIDMTEEDVRKMLTLCNHAYIDKAESMRTDPRMELRAD